MQRVVRGSPQPSSAAVLAGSGRSGTTWLADVLSRCSGVQQIFEPLHPVAVEEVRRITGWDESLHPHIRSMYVRAGSAAPEWRDLLRRVLEGRVRNYWTDYRRTSFFPSQLLVKVIRANLMLGYMHDEFHPRIAYVVRHPCAVVASRLSIPWHANVQDILSQEELVQDHLLPYVGEIERESDLLGAHAVWWAVENLVATKELGERSHHLVFYEEACLDPKSCLAEVCAWFGFDSDSLPLSELEKPSRMARSKSLHRPSVERLGAWREKLSGDDIRRILRWAHRLGLAWYEDSPFPRHLEVSDGSRPG